MHKYKVAYVCVHNSCRSQMAEAITKINSSNLFEDYSAGTHLKPQINQDAVSIIQELYHYDMNQTQKSKLIDALPKDIDIVITMGCNVDCPYLPCLFREDWGLEDPTGKGKEEFISIAKQIEKNIDDLANRIATGEIILKK